MKYLLKIFLAIFLVLMSVSTYSQNVCKVLITELEGFYDGKCKNGLAHGKGVAKGKDEYSGRFKKGLPHGAGKYIWSTGESFDGNWRNGKKNGKGIYTIITSEKDSVLYGIWVDDVFKEVIIPDPYDLIYKNNITNYTIKRTGDGEKVVITIVNKGDRNNYYSLYIDASSGNNFTNGDVFGIEHFQTPLTLKITYLIPSVFNNASMNVTFEIKIVEPGSYSINLRH